MRMRIDVIEFFNQLIEREEKLIAVKEKLEKLVESENLPSVVEDTIADIQINETLDVGFQIVASYLDSFAARTVELNDKKLIEYCKGLHIVTENTDE